MVEEGGELVSELGEEGVGEVEGPSGADEGGGVAAQGVRREDERMGICEGLVFGKVLVGGCRTGRLGGLRYDAGEGV